MPKHALDNESESESDHDDGDNSQPTQKPALAAPKGQTFHQWQLQNATAPTTFSFSGNSISFTASGVRANGIPPIPAPPSSSSVASSTVPSTVGQTLSAGIMPQSIQAAPLAIPTVPVSVSSLPAPVASSQVTVVPTVAVATASSYFVPVSTGSGLAAVAGISYVPVSTGSQQIATTNAFNFPVAMATQPVASLDTAPVAANVTFGTTHAVLLPPPQAPNPPARRYATDMEGVLYYLPVQMEDVVLHQSPRWEVRDYDGDVVMEDPQRPQVQWPKRLDAVLGQRAFKHRKQKKSKIPARVIQMAEEEMIRRRRST
ncbi:hypothetical protein ABW20_dc0104350 [Dactylellina cionopaga]|nr:hypothetical protein ABW20_dc0104350 [Dactylellina cionopaga]